MTLAEMMRANKIEPRIKAEIAGNTAVVYMHGTVGDSWFDDSISAKSVREQLNGFEGDEIELHINSFGGDMFEGIAIKNYLSNRPEKVTAYIDGIAASAASIIAMCADTIIMPADTQLMIHNPWTYTAGNAKELRKVAEQLEVAQTSLEETYMKRFVGEREELKALLDAETFLTAEQAIQFGLADAVEKEGSLDTVSDKLVSSLMAKYKKPVSNHLISDDKTEEEEPTDGPAEEPEEKEQPNKSVTIDKFAGLFA